MGNKYFFKVFVISLLVMLFSTLTAFAGNIVVRTVNIGMSTTRQADGVVYEAYPVLRSTDMYDDSYAETSTYVIDTEATVFNKRFEDWKAGEPITVTVTILPKAGYKFDTSSTVVNVIGNNVNLKEKTVLSRKIKLKLKYWPSMKLPCVDESTIEYDEKNEYRIKWEAVLVDGAKWKNYEVMVKNEDADDKSILTKKVTTNRADLSDMLMGKASAIAIRTIGGTVKKEMYTINSDWVVWGEDYKSGSASVKGSFSGSGEKLVYLDESGNRISGWLNINDCWFYFDPENSNRAVVNKMACIKNHWYYFAENGIMHKGWKKLDGYWYYFNPVNDKHAGRMKTGWITEGPGGPYYYMNDGSVKDYPLGAMLVDTVTPDGYTVDASGKWVK